MYLFWLFVLAPWLLGSDLFRKGGEGGEGFGGLHKPLELGVLLLLAGLVGLQLLPGVLVSNTRKTGL